MRSLSLIAAAAMLAACSGDSSTNPGTITPTRQLTTDSAGTWVYVELDDTAEMVTVTNPAASTVWDIAFMGTSVMLNGGAAGPGDARGYCICQNASATNEQVAAMTATTELADFEAVTADDIPSPTAFEADELVPAISGWHDGAGTLAVADPTPFLIAVGSGSARVVGKFHVIELVDPTATSPGSVIFEHVLQTAPGTAFGAVETDTVAVGASPVYFDLDTKAVSNASNWDIQFDGWNIRVNSGASGSGSVRALIAEGTAFGDIDAEFAASPPEIAFMTDVFSGVFATNRWYRYNITGTDNQIWPTYNVYLIAVGDDIYKVQLISYYNTAGSARFITLRYARIQ